jgi:hypothetical protein
VSAELVRENGAGWRCEVVLDKCLHLALLATATNCLTHKLSIESSTYCMQHVDGFANQLML